MNTNPNVLDQAEANLLTACVSDEMLEQAAATDAVANFTLNDCTTLSECPAN